MFINPLLPPNPLYQRPVQQLLLILIFCSSFFSVSAFAFEDDNTWDPRYYYYSYLWNDSYSAPTKSSLCSLLGAVVSASGLYCERYNSDGGITFQNKIYTGTCPSDPENWSYGDPSCGVEPTPSEPQSCADLESNNPDGIFITMDSYAGEACHQGCTVIVGPVATQDPVAGTWTSTSYFTTEECNGGFNLDSGTEPMKDAYQHDNELQNCYDTNGSLVGQISVDLSCPTLSICYDPNTGTKIGTTSQSTACVSGVKYNELDNRFKDTPSTSTTITTNPDGSTVETKETITEQTGLDGSTQTTKQYVVIGKDADGNETSRETTEEETTSGNTASAKCKLRPNLPECQIKDDSKASATLSDNCVTPPVCTGDPVGCASVELQWKQVCAYEALTREDFEEWRTSAAAKDEFGVETDENGMLTSINRGEIDLNETMNLDQLGDHGAAGSCPAPYPMNIQGSNIEFKYDLICELSTTIRPIVIFSSLFICFVMVRRTTMGA